MNIPLTLEHRTDAGFGPVPTVSAAPRPPLASRAAAAVLDAVSQTGQPVTAAELADSLGQHPNTVREHLDALVDAGLVVRQRAAATGRGRPAWLYAALPVEEPAHGEYAGLARALARQLARTSRQPQDDAVAAGRLWGEDLAADTGGAGGIRTSAAARRAVVQLLDGLGFDPHADSRTTRVRLRRCPLLDAALEQPDVVCSVHLGIVQGALATWRTDSTGTRLVPFAEPGACVLELSTPTGTKPA